MAGILVLGELAQGRPRSITGELLAAGRRLGEALGEEVAAAFLGGEMDAASGEAIARGADSSCRHAACNGLRSAVTRRPSTSSPSPVLEA